jgi:hypothetical protein
MVGLTDVHADTLAERYPNDAPFIKAITGALTKALVPHLPVLPMFLAMKQFLDQGRFGVLADHRLVRVPLSIIPADRKRYRTPIVSLLHETVLSFRMSEYAVNAVSGALKPFGLCVIYLCSCGVVMGRCADIAHYRGSPAHLQMDRLRSAIDAEGNPVVEVRSWNEIPMPSMDIAANCSEIEMFESISDLALLAASAESPEFPWIGDCLMSSSVALKRNKAHLCCKRPRLIWFSALPKGWLSGFLFSRLVL